MTNLPMFPGFDGLMTLSRREGVDIRPTLLRVLTDLYVQTSAHTDDEERQYLGWRDPPRTSRVTAMQRRCSTLRIHELFSLTRC
jgi:hypothetical protein